jgi:hypothetical protein
MVAGLESWPRVWPVTPTSHRPNETVSTHCRYHCILNAPGELISFENFQADTLDTFERVLKLFEICRIVAWKRSKCKQIGDSSIHAVDASFDS